jgi:hypothetical protein
MKKICCVLGSSNPVDASLICRNLPFFNDYFNLQNSRLIYHLYQCNPRPNYRKCHASHPIYNTLRQKINFKVGIGVLEPCL